MEYPDRHKALVSFLKEQPENVIEGENPDEFKCDGFHYEVVTKEYAIEVAKEYAISEGVEECIGDDQIEYWEPLTGSKFWYRGL